MVEGQRPDRAGVQPGPQDIAAVEERKLGDAARKDPDLAAVEERVPDASGPEHKDQEVAAYEKLRQEVKRLLAEVRENVNAETVKQVLDKASARMKEAGGYTAEVVGKASEALKKDLARTAQRLGPKWSEFSEKSADLFAVWRDRGTHFLGRAAVATGEWLQKTGSRLEHQTYRSGEITYGGTFECTGCKETTVLTQSGRLSDCPRCAGTEFRRAA
jgi:Zinc-ribbon containing domain